VKVEFCKTVEVESEVEIDTDDIVRAVEDLYNNCVAVMDGETTIRQKSFAVGQFVTAVYQCLQGVPDRMILQLKPSQREIIANALLAQADRFSVKSIMQSESDGAA
jgi:hypothetical protein